MTDANRRTFPAGLAGMLLAVVVVEAWIARQDVHYSGMGPACWRLSRGAAFHQRETEILCLGTSLSKFGLLPRVIEERTGRRAFNLAVFSGPLPASYYLLRRALASGARPAAIIFDDEDMPVPPERHSESPTGLEHNWRSWPELLDLIELVELAWTARDARFLGLMLMSKELPSYRARFEIRACLLASLAGRSASTWPEVLQFTRNVRVNRGAFVVGTPRPEHEVAGTLPSMGVAPGIEVRAPAPLVESDVHALYRQRLIDLAASHGIRIFWLIPPASEAQREKNIRSGFIAYVQRAVGEALRTNPSLVVIDGEGASYPRTVFADGIHLDRRGATTLSFDVAEIVARALGDRPGPRRVMLPDYRSRSTTATLEDVDQSTAILFPRFRRK